MKTISKKSKSIKFFNFRIEAVYNKSTGFGLCFSNYLTWFSIKSNRKQLINLRDFLNEILEWTEIK